MIWHDFTLDFFIKSLQNHDKNQKQKNPNFPTLQIIHNYIRYTKNQNCSVKSVIVELKKLFLEFRKFYSWGQLLAQNLGFI